MQKHTHPSFEVDRGSDPNANLLLGWEHELLEEHKPNSRIVPNWAGAVHGGSQIVLWSICAYAATALSNSC